MKIKGTVRLRINQLGTFGIFTSKELAKFGDKEVEIEVTEVTTEKPEQGATVTEKVK